VAAHQRARLHGAMAELSADQGYRSVTIRALTKRAGVSTRAFYIHFGDKEGCLFSAYEQIVRRTAKRVAHARSGESDWRKRLRLAFRAFVREVDRDPRAANLALVEIYAAGPKGFARVQRAEAMFEAMLAESFVRSSPDLAMPQSLVRGIVAGVTRVTRARVLAGDRRELLSLGDELTDWTLCYYSDAVGLLPELDQSVSMWEPTASSVASAGGQQATRLNGDRALIISAIVRLAATSSYDELTAPEICNAAGVSRKTFDSHFASVEDCFVAAVQGEAVRTFEQLMSFHGTGPDWDSSDVEHWAKGVHQRMLDFCAQLRTNSSFARLCLGSFSTPGSVTIRCGERLLEKIEGTLLNQASLPVGPGDLRLQASVGAAWGALCHQLAAGSSHRSRPVLSVASLSFLATAPLVGPANATAAIRDATLKASAQAA
jgi:AcrR family transcriptional regulator